MSTSQEARLKAKLTATLEKWLKQEKAEIATNPNISVILRTERRTDGVRAKPHNKIHFSEDEVRDEEILEILNIRGITPEPKLIFRELFATGERIVNENFVRNLREKGYDLSKPLKGGIRNNDTDLVRVMTDNKISRLNSVLIKHKLPYRFEDGKLKKIIKKPKKKRVQSVLHFSVFCEISVSGQFK